MAILSQAFERRKVQRLDTTRLKGSTPWRRNSPDYERVAAMPPVAKAIAARKSLGPKRPCGFDSRPRHTKKHRSGDAFLVPSTVISVPGQISGRFPARTAAYSSAAGKGQVRAPRKKGPGTCIPRPLGSRSPRWVFSFASFTKPPAITNLYCDNTTC